MLSFVTRSSDAAWDSISKVRISAGISASAWAAVPVQWLVADADAAFNSSSSDVLRLGQRRGVGVELRASSWRTCRWRCLRRAGWPTRRRPWRSSRRRPRPARTGLVAQERRRSSASVALVEIAASSRAKRRAREPRVVHREARGVVAEPVERGAEQSDDQQGYEAAHRFSLPNQALASSATATRERSISSSARGVAPVVRDLDAQLLGPLVVDPRAERAAHPQSAG